MDCNSFPGMLVQPLDVSLSIQTFLIVHWESYQITQEGYRMISWCFAMQLQQLAITLTGFMVDATAFGTSAGQIGISASSFSSCLNKFPKDSNNCQNEPYGNCTIINGGSAYDQFSSFRTDLWSRYIPLDSSWSCAFRANGFLPAWSSYFSTQYRQALMPTEAFVLP